jgi:hypothetical protein
VKVRKQGVCHTLALPFTLKKYLKAKQEYYGNSNISPCKEKPNSKNLPKETKILQDHIIYN